MSEQQPRNLFQLLLIDIWIIITWQNWIDNMHHILGEVVHLIEKRQVIPSRSWPILSWQFVISVNEAQIQQQNFKRC